MSTATLLLFFFLLLVLLAYAYKLPSLALPIGIMTFSYKQIATLAVPFFQNHDTVFNFIVAGPIVLIFCYYFISKIRLSCYSKDGQLIMKLVWAFLLYFWCSSLWSPFTGFDSWKFLPYFIVYVWILPLLIDDDPEVVIKAFQLTWILTFFGALALLLSPDFSISPDIERMVIHYRFGRFEESNPLVLADMAAYLIMMSLLILVWNAFDRERGKFIKTIHSFAACLGLVLGFWLAINTARGETFSVILCGCFFIALIKGKSISHSILWLAGLLLSSLISIAVIILLFIPKNSIEQWSARYSQTSIVEGSDIRNDMNTKNVQSALASPAKFVFGMGARGGEKHLGTWPHNHFVQAFSEAGIIGITLLCICCFLSLRFGFRTLSLARESGDYPSLIFTAFIISLLIYELVVLSKKGSLTFIDTYMWLAIAVYSFDRTQNFLQSSPNMYYELESRGEILEDI